MKERESAYLLAVSAEVPLDRFQRIVARAAIDAEAGDHRARSWLGQFLLPQLAPGVQFDPSQVVTTWPANVQEQMDREPQFRSQMEEYRRSLVDAFADPAGYTERRRASIAKIMDGIRERTGVPLPCEPQNGNGYEAN